MNDDMDAFERELSGLKPASPPLDCLKQIDARRPSPGAGEVGPAGSRLKDRKPTWLWWLAPAPALVCLAVILNQPHPGVRKPPLPAHPGVQASFKADQVEIDRQLVTNFDAIAQLPSGAPVRFRCEQWMDKVRLRDSAAGLVLERTTPRLEIRPVKFETY